MHRPLDLFQSRNEFLTALKFYQYEIIFEVPHSSKVFIPMSYNECERGDSYAFLVCLSLKIR